MLLIVGSVVVIACIVVGYLMEGGALGAPFQPAELVIIGGAAFGALLISTPLPLLKRIFGSVGAFFKDGPGKQDYLELLGMMYQTFRLTQQSGVMALEAHCDDPASSSIFSRYPKFLANHEAVDFLADSAKVILVGGISAHDLEALMDEDIKVHHEQALKPAAALTKIGDALPGLGIVAAVLGIVITMGHIDGPAEEIGHHVGSALVGTFLGILLSYGFCQPLASNLEARVDNDAFYCICIKAGLLALYKGNPPAIAIEFARRVLPHDVRPTFNETEQFCKAAGKVSSEQAAAA